MKRLISGATVVVALAGLFVYSGSVQAQAVKYDICHADGRDGTIKFSFISVPLSAAMTHLDPFTGTTAAGHEDDVLGVGGKCPEPPK